LGNACEDQISEEGVARERGSALSHCGRAEVGLYWGCGCAAEATPLPNCVFQLLLFGVFRGTWMFGWWCDCFLSCLRSFIGTIEFVVTGVCLQIVRSMEGDLEMARGDQQMRKFETFDPVEAGYVASKFEDCEGYSEIG
jgi:hypothetical protein